jgi:hypothetical protein
MELVDYVSRFFLILGGLIICGLVIFTGVTIVQSARADGHIEYCYIQLDNVSDLPMYKLWGYRAWCSDRKIATFPAMDDAVNAADKLQCPLRKK